MLAEELVKKVDAEKKRRGLGIFLGIFFLVLYLIGSMSGTSTQQASAPVEPAHPSAASSDGGLHPPLGPVGTATVPQRTLATVVKSRPACLLADDYVQLVNMAISPGAVRSAVDFANDHCQRLELGQKVWLDDKAVRMIDGSRTIKLACVAITLYTIAPKTLPPDYKPANPTCYWTDLSALDEH